MNYYLQLKYPDALRPCSRQIHEFARDLEQCIAESDFMRQEDTDMSVTVLLNEDVSKHANLTNINSVLSFDFSALGEGFSASSKRAFVLSCMRLRYTEIQGLKNVIIKFVIGESARQSASQDHQQGDDELVKSFDAVSPKYKFDNMILDQSTKLQIDRAITLIRNQKLIFEEWGFQEIDPFTKTILCFYGHSGTGKTMCAHAMANELGKKIIIASYASIESKWVGEGPKNLRKIYQDAEEQDAILFFDEADSFLSKRVQNAETGSDKHYNRMSNEMFQLLENYNGIVIFATNLVADFDKAFKSRILAFIEFSLPNVETRAKLIKVMIPSHLPMSDPLTDEELRQLSEMIDGFSGREIRKGVLTVLSDGAMRGISNFTYEDFKRGFVAVKEDTESIEASMNEGKHMANCVEDFIQYSEENAAIIEICLNAVWQDEIITDGAKKELFRICKLLGVEMPEVKTRAYLKDLSVSAEKLIGSGRESESMRYCCDLLSKGELSEQQVREFIYRLGDVLLISNVTPYINYFNSLKQLE